MFFSLFFSVVSAAIYGIDYSTLTSVASHQCFINNGFTFAIPRCWCSVGEVDGDCVPSVENAHAAGMSRVDTYFFPCYSCGNIAGQINSFWDHTIANQMNFERLWFDIEGEWSSSYGTNQAFLMEMVEHARAIGIVYGIYCSEYYWGLFFGSYTFAYASEAPMWYAHYDYDASFSDWTPFGGWSWPMIKQYQGTTSMCDASVDLNYQE